MPICGTFLVKSLGLTLLSGICLEDPNAGEGLLHLGGQTGILLLQFIRTGVDHPGYEKNRKGQERHRDKGEERQPRRNPEHDREGRRNDDTCTRCIHHGRSDVATDVFDIAGGARDQVPGGVLQIEIVRQGLEFVIQTITQVVFDMPGGDDQGLAHQERKQAAAQAQNQHDDPEACQRKKSLRVDKGGKGRPIERLVSSNKARNAVNGFTHHHGYGYGKDG